MDEDRLASQLAETGNIMDFCQDPTWLEETAQIEKECGGYVEAGLLLREYAVRENLHPGPPDRATSSAKCDRRASSLAAGTHNRN